mmetsp:Transcript_19092/g.44211  ORF Transcript_19092/g.44211 Transcript_19092/m.44211 type:complete len:86 (-) Transcript_19092:462-719(-)
MDESTFTNSNKSFVSSRMKNPEAENSLAQSENEKTRWLRHYDEVLVQYTHIFATFSQRRRRGTNRCTTKDGRLRETVFATTLCIL